MCDQGKIEKSIKIKCIISFIAKNTHIHLNEFTNSTIQLLIGIINVNLYTIEYNFIFNMPIRINKIII